MIKGNYLDKLQDRIDQCRFEIKHDMNVEIRQHQLEHYLKRLNQVKHNRRVITLWEHSNNLWFNGSDSDVYSFEDLVAHCNQLQFGEKPLDLIREGIYVAIGGSAIAPYDLREYIYLPTSLIEEDVDLHNLKDAFEDYVPIE